VLKGRVNRVRDQRNRDVTGIAGQPGPRGGQPCRICRAPPRPGWRVSIPSPRALLVTHPGQRGSRHTPRRSAPRIPLRPPHAPLPAAHEDVTRPDRGPEHPPPCIPTVLRARARHPIRNNDRTPSVSTRSPRSAGMPTRAGGRGAAHNRRARRISGSMADSSFSRWRVTASRTLAAATWRKALRFQWFGVGGGPLTSPRNTAARKPTPGTRAPRSQPPPCDQLPLHSP